MPLLLGRTARFVQGGPANAKAFPHASPPSQGKVGLRGLGRRPAPLSLPTMRPSEMSPQGGHPLAFSPMATPSPWYGGSLLPSGDRVFHIDGAAPNPLSVDKREPVRVPTAWADIVDEEDGDDYWSLRAVQAALRGRRPLSSPGVWLDLGSEREDGVDDKIRVEGAPFSETRRLAAEAPAPPLGASHPSLGSMGHAAGSCTKCVFFARGRCVNGYSCTFCHYGHPKSKSTKAAKERRNRKSQPQLERTGSSASTATPAAASDGSSSSVETPPPMQPQPAPVTGFFGAPAVPAVPYMAQMVVPVPVVPAPAVADQVQPVMLLGDFGGATVSAAADQVQPVVILGDFGGALPRPPQSMHFPQPMQPQMQPEAQHLHQPPLMQLPLQSL